MDIEAVAKKAQDRIDYDAATNPTIRRILTVVKEFLQSARVMCYGGTAINNLLPKDKQFYDPNYDIPDYDFYSETPQFHAMQLADRFHALGYANIEVRPGSHLLTFKVFVEYTGVADITYLEPAIFKALWKEDIVQDKIHYVTPNFLRMSMYLELSRPKGDVSRWTKVYRRLMLLNKQYPVGCKKAEADEERHELSEDSRGLIENLLRTKQIILLGLHATKLHSRSKDNVWQLPLDVLVTPDKFEDYVAEFAAIFEDKPKIVVHPAYAELLPKHADILDKESGTLLVRVFETMACHSFHEMTNGIRVASIPTLLQFFFAFVYADSHFLEGFDAERIVCIAQRLVDMANKDSSRRYDLLTPLECLGHQETLVEIRGHTAALKAKTPKDSADFLRFFFSYDPAKFTKTQKQSLRKKLRKTLKKAPTDELVLDHEE
jgi:hypothetical protein